MNRCSCEVSNHCYVVFKPKLAGWLTSALKQRENQSALNSTVQGTAVLYWLVRRETLPLDWCSKKDKKAEVTHRVRALRLTLQENNNGQ